MMCCFDVDVLMVKEWVLRKQVNELKDREMLLEVNKLEEG